MEPGQKGNADAQPDLGPLERFQDVLAFRCPKAIETGGGMLQDSLGQGPTVAMLSYLSSKDILWI